MAERPITIHSVCVTTPDEHVHVKAGDRVRWQADHAAIYVLHIPGGFFQGEPNNFTILVVSTLWTKDYVVAGTAGDTLTNYIYDLSGNNCLLLTDGPPDIIIDSAIMKHPKKAGRSNKKKAPN